MQNPVQRNKSNHDHTAYPPRRRGRRLHNLARELAWHVLVELDRSTYCQHLDDMVHRACDDYNLPPRDHALAYELVSGCIRNKTLLEFYISQCSARSAAALDTGLRWILVLALYQIEFLDRVAAYAAVNETVEICHHVRRSEWAGYANGVLRTFLRQRELRAIREPDDLATRWSHPSWLVELYAAVFGAENVEPVLRWNNQIPIHYARVRGVREEVLAALPPGAAEPANEFGADMLRLRDVPRVIHSAAFRDGALYVMQPWSVRTARVLGLQPGWRVLDMCAAPGGKSIILADDGASHVVALDNAAHRIRALNDNLRRCHITTVEPRVLDGRDVLDVFPPRSFDAVLLDAPCSNLGVVQRHPEIRWRVSPDEPARLAREQRALLAAALRAVKPGGPVLYAVCTVTPDETTAVVAEAAQALCEFQELTCPGTGGFDGGYAALLRPKGMVSG